MSIGPISEVTLSATPSGAIGAIADVALVSVPPVVLGPSYRFPVVDMPTESAGATLTFTLSGLPAESIGPTLSFTPEGTFMGIRAKQLRPGTFGGTGDDLANARAVFGSGLFDATLASSVFVDGSIPSTKLAANSVGPDQVSATLAGNGLEKTAVDAAITVKPDALTGGNTVPVTVALNGVGLDLSAIDDPVGGIEANAGTLRIIDGGVTAAKLNTDVPPSLISGGTREVDGDLLDVNGITYNNITPTTATTGAQVHTATLVDHLAAHLIGIDNALSSAGGIPQQEQITAEDITGTDTVIAADLLSVAPSSAAAVKVFLNGLLQQQGAGFDYELHDSTSTTGAQVPGGDLRRIFWLASSGTAVDMVAANDVLIVVYES